ncbi:MAG: Hsp20/alpha crystallin family protein [Deltaproteobacteria bacterium]|nr:Hsp20/alpha crystallin family protein [Deltaproteobacteria bacterium]
MALDKWSPLKELETMKKEMDRIWEDIFPSGRRVDIPWKKEAAPKGPGVATPAIDIIDKNGEVIVKAEMPGVTKENIDISLQENTLTIKGELKAEPGVSEESYSYSERKYCYYARSINIPFKIERENIKASLKDGILSIHIPKVQEAQPRKINVEIS